jgi:cell division transport system ATP-binding protein
VGSDGVGTLRPPRAVRAGPPVRPRNDLPARARCLCARPITVVPYSSLLEVTSLIRLRGVTLTYPNGTRALDGVDLDIEKGSFVFLVGHSGTGKSSLLKLMYREQIPTSGEVTVDGIRVDTLRRSRVPKLRRNIGVVFQDFKLLSHKTVWENVAFALQVTGAKTRDVMRQVPRALDMVGLSHKSRMFPSELSGGEQQRTAIARALVCNPKLLLCDEPTGNLDPSNTTEIMELLQRINLKGTTVVVATHNQAVVDRMRRRVVRLEHGRILHDDEKGYYFGGLGQTAVLPG